MIAAVLDTNVLAAGFVGLADPMSVPGELLRRWRGKEFTLVVSAAILAELTRVFSYPYFARRLTTNESEAALAGLRQEAVVQPITDQISGIAAHSQDDLIIATAASAQAPYLVTGDKLLLQRGGFRGTRFVTPREFLVVLQSQTEDSSLA